VVALGMLIAPVVALSWISSAAVGCAPPTQAALVFQAPPAADPTIVAISPYHKLAIYILSYSSEVYYNSYGWY
jgi:hypothetical protein